jgi:hypothetical protein
MVVQYLATDYDKALPNFFRILDVPFVALSEVANINYKLNSANCIKFLHSNIQFADDAWFKTCGKPSNNPTVDAEEISNLERVENPPNLLS